MRWRELPAELKRQDCIEAHTWGRQKKILLHWSYSGFHNSQLEEGSSRTLPRAGRPAKLSNWWRRALSRLATKNLMVSWVPWSYMQMGKTYTNITATLHRFLWRCGQTQISLKWRHENTLNLQKKHLKDPQTLRNKIINSKNYVWRKLLCSSPAEYNPKSKVCW